MADYVLILRPLKSDVPPEVRLRRALKALLRVYDLRAVHVDAVPSAGGQDDVGPEQRDREPGPLN